MTFVEKARELVKAELKRQNKTPYAIAMEADLDTGNLWRFLNTKTPCVSFELVMKILKAVGVNPGDVIVNEVQ